MRSYPAENWKRLGRWVHDARLRAGWLDMKDWSLAVERSTRQLQGLERGEPVGEKTLQRVATTLNRDFSVLIDLLAESEEIPSVSTNEHDEPEFEFLTRVREDLTTEQMEQLMSEATPYLEMLVRDIKNRNREQG